MTEETLTTEDGAEPAESMLRRLAEEYGPDSKLPSVRELSRRFGLPSAELDAALAEMERDELIYRRHRVGIYVSEKILRKNIHIILEPRMVQNSGTSPVWGQVWGTLLTIAEQRAADGESYTFHMSNTISRPGPIRDLFHKELERGRVNAVLGIGLGEPMVQEMNRYRVPVISYSGAGNHLVVTSMHEQVQTVTGMLADAGCRRIEFWSRANTGVPTQMFSVYDITDPAGIIARFRDPYDRPAQRIATRATAETARRLAAYRDTDAPSFDLRHRITDVINVTQFQDWLFDENVFEDVELREETVRAIAVRGESNLALVTANHLLIQDTFAREILRADPPKHDDINAFRAAMRRYFPEVETAVVRHAGRVNSGDVGNQLPGYNLARTVFGSQERPDGLVIEDDMIASGVHKALEELGVRIGVDVKIATHANAGSAIGFGLHGRVIQMVFDPSEFVQAMFSLLDQDTAHDLDRMTIARVEPRILAPGRHI